MRQNKPSNQISTILWGITGVLLIALLFARAIYPEFLWFTIMVCVPLVACLGLLVHQHRKALKSRTVAYGANSLVTVVLVISIVGVVDFLSERYPYKIDLTKNKIHSLSDQTIKVVKGLSQPTKAVYFSKFKDREHARPLLENYKGLNPKFEVEYVDPDREPTRVKEAGVKHYGTLHLQIGSRETNVEDVSEEKITNALIKITREKIPLLCALAGHGEHSLDSSEADGYIAMKKAMMEQSYDTKTVNIMQEGKLPEACDALAILGPTKSFFPQEAKIISDYLANGGRALVALDVNLKGEDFAPELVGILKNWSIQSEPSMIIDPVSKQMGSNDASVPVVFIYSRENPITRDFQERSFFPILRYLDVATTTPPEMKVQWLAKTTPNAIKIKDVRQVASGKPIDETRMQGGSYTAAIAVEGKQKDSKASKATRLVVFGTSTFANNAYARFGLNSDFFLNSVAWVLEDTNMISIRTHDDTAGKIQLTQKESIFIFLLTVILIPLAVSVSGVVVWFVRRRL